MNTTGASPPTDANLWPDDVHDDNALGWVREHNAMSSAILMTRPDFVTTRDRLRESIDSKW